MRKPLAALVTAVLCLGGAAACADNGSTPSTSTSGAAGGDLVIVRPQDSVSMDNTMVFSNSSIWVFQQMFESLYEVTPDGKDVKPLLAESHTLSDDKLTWTFKLKQGVKFSNGQPMTSADVKFSLDKARATKGGWEFLDVAIKSVEAPDDATVVIKTKYPWSPLLADLANFNNAVLPKDYAGKSHDDFYKAPIGTGPFVWDHWNKGTEIQLKKNPTYWDAGKPALDSVTWKVVPDDNSRNVQIQGGQAQINENPPFSTLEQLKGQPNVKVDLFPSTKTDYIMMNQNEKPYDDVHVRRAISYAIDREALVKTLLFGNGTPANSFLMPNVPFYDAATPGITYDMAKAKEEMAQSSVPNGFSTTFLASSGDSTDQALAQVLQSSLKELGIDMKIQNVDPSAAHDLQQEQKYQISHSYWTMDIADPDELVTFAVDPDAGSHSFYTSYDNPTVIADTKKAQQTFDTAGRQELYSAIQKQAAEDAFMGFLYYSPFSYAYSTKVSGFQVYPTGNYHLEDVTLGS
ncbi:peptide/nickel transport system substrate-binding protein [Microlunatus sagamiharensis]|uniref:Peptide/nickel transport system substrate-binding protein n=1 Tax=Microlunatus sagamiharensis TaxID=546874 RepID=A0A1H2LIT7_9ACTN|nr:ABC transporter substrate-binding protein [Microlunatus sagamiharensis]SDU80953.1 peptide/nickel transport system substrate-binding protein [Microlunatus sagamiharensis]